MQMQTIKAILVEPNEFAKVVEIDVTEGFKGVASVLGCSKKEDPNFGHLQIAEGEIMWEYDGTTITERDGQRVKGIIMVYRDQDKRIKNNLWGIKGNIVFMFADIVYKEGEDPFTSQDEDKWSVMSFPDMPQEQMDAMIKKVRMGRVYSLYQ